jgi:hypothetical protein
MIDRIVGMHIGNRTMDMSFPPFGTYSIMTSVVEAPLRPMSADTCPSVDDPIDVDISHLSGMTMTELTKQPKIHLITTSPAVSKRSSLMASSKRASVNTTSTTKSQLRHSNHLLIEMLQNIQSELATQRTIMLDIQHRVSHLEDESSIGEDNSNTLAALKALEGGKDASRRSSKMIGPEGLFWWETCRNFARNSESPIDMGEFLRTPRPSSGLKESLRPNTPPTTPPAVDDLPPLTPTSEECDSNVSTPMKHDILLGEEIFSSTPRGSGVDDDAGSDIKERVVEVNKKRLPAPPVLLPPPGAKSVVAEFEEAEPEVTQNPHRFYKGVKSLSTYKALLKHKATEKGKMIQYCCAIK